MFSGINRPKIVIVRKYKNLLYGFKESCVLVGHHPVRKYILLDVLVYNIAVYFYEFCSILTSPQGESKYKERVKIYSDIVHQNIS